MVIQRVVAGVEGDRDLFLVNMSSTILFLIKTYLEEEVVEDRLLFLVIIPGLVYSRS
jgi:hypothetical protein